MIGAPKAPTGGFGITSAPRTGAPETGNTVGQQKGAGRANNPVLQRLMADGFEGHGAQGRGLAVGHAKKADKAGKAGKPTEGTTQPGGPQQGIQQMLEQLKALLGQLAPKAGEKPQPQPQPSGTPQNTGIVPPSAKQDTAPAPALKPYPI
jgi:hypothetical protein